MGVVTPEAISTIFYAVKSKLEQEKAPIRIKRKIFNILVECIQNLYHHSDDFKNIENNENLNTSYIQLSKKENEDEYEITTGNIISKESEKQLKQRLAEINLLDKDSLRERFRFILADGSFSDKGTAGLGFLDIARKSNNKLNFDFKSIDDHYSYFILNVKVN